MANRGGRQSDRTNINVQSDWNATSGDAFIKNKPDVGTKEYACFSLSTGGTTTIGSTAKQLVINNTDVNSNSSVFSLASNTITVDKAGDFKISFDLYLNNSSTARTEYSFYLRKNGTQISRTVSSSYQRGYDSGMSSSINTIQTLASGDELDVYVVRTDGTGVIGYQDDNGTRFVIEEK